MKALLFIGIVGFSLSKLFITWVFLWAILFFAGIKYQQNKGSSLKGAKRKIKAREPDYFGFPSKPYISAFERVSVPKEEKTPITITKFQSAISHLKFLAMFLGALIYCIVVIPIYGIFYIIKSCFLFIFLSCLGLCELILKVLKISESTSAWAEKQLQGIRDLGI